MKCREEVVGEAGRQTGDTIRGRGRDEEQIDGLRDEDVIEGPFEIAAGMRPFKHIHINLTAGERSKRQWRNKLRGAFRHENRDIDAAILKAPENLRRLVARNSAADAESYFHSSGSS